MTKQDIARAASLLALAGGMLGAVPALAQSADKAGNDEIVVTARRVEERLQDVPISITVFNQEQLAQRNIVSTTDLAAYAPSLSLNGRYGPDKSSFAIRGFSQDLNTLPTVGVYFADVVAPRLNSNITSGNGAGPGSMFDLQNVQVLKGPQGTLFGRNTTGGAILLVPQRPTSRLEGYVEGTIGNHNERRLQAVLNVPLSDTFKIRLGVDRNKRDGYIHNRSGIGPSEFNDVNYTAVRLGVLGNLTPSLETYTLFTYADSHTNGTLPKMAYCNRATVAGSTGSSATVRVPICAQVDREAAQGYGFYDAENNDPTPYVRSRQWQVINTTTWNATDSLTVKNIASYGEAREHYSFSLDGDAIPYPFVITYPGPARPQGAQYTFTEEFQLQGHSAGDRLTWQAGGYMERSAPLGSQEQYTQIFANCSNPYTFQCSPLVLQVPLGGGVILPVSAGSVSIARNNYTFHNYGLYAQATYKFTDQLSLTAGIRNTWDWEREDADNIQVKFSTAGVPSYVCSRAVTSAPKDATLLTNGACGTGRSFVQKSSRPTWLIDLDFKPTPDTLVYAKYARGYRGGGINEANFGIETWKPEKVDDYEIGMKASFRGQVHGNLALAGFWNEFRDQQASVTIPQCTAVIPGCTNPAPTGINGIQNVGKSRMRGFEIEGSVGTGPVRLDFGYSYLDAKVTGGSVPFCDNTRFICSQASFLTAGSVLPFAPKNRVTLTGTLDLPVDEKLGRVSVSATFTHTDSQYSSHSNDAAAAVGAIPYNAGISPATNLLNLNFNWKGVAGSPVDLAVFATNVTNRKYWVSVVNGLSTLGGEAVILGEPRMYGVRLKVNFGK
ncbi:MAG: TonB-dependent receptor [Sphingomonadales bacterium]|nr:TonB-dependent receptor [Sphingomonadales bacterium]